MRQSPDAIVICRDNWSALNYGQESGNEIFTPNRSEPVYQILLSDQAAPPEILVIRRTAERFSQRKIRSTLSVGDHRVNRILREFHTEAIIPTLLHRGRSRKVTKAILDFIDIRTLQEPIPEWDGEERAV